MPRVIDVDERRSELARAASRLIARAGIGAATMREVAAEAGWTTGALTHYFDSKRALMLFTFRESLAARRAASDAQPPLDDPVERLLRSLESALPIDADQREHWMVSIAFCAEAAGDAELSTVQRETYREHRDRVAGRVVGTGLAAADVEQLAERLIAVVDGIALQALFDPDGWPADRQRAQLRAAVAPLLA